MRITKISVKGLFWMFDHEIPLNQESRITIIHGPNGVGKTVLMRMVHGLFHHDYGFLGETPFQELRIDFKHGAFIIVDKSEDSDSLSIKYDDVAGSQFRPFTPSYDATEFELGMYMNAVEPKLSLVASGDKQYWWDSDKSTLYTQEDILNKYPNALLAIYGEMPHWFDRVRENVVTDFIPIERLRSDELALQDSLKNKERNDDPSVPLLNLPILLHLSSRVEAKLNDLISLPNKLTEDVYQNLNPATKAIRAASEKLSNANTPTEIEQAEIEQAKKDLRNALKSAAKFWQRHNVREAVFRQRFNAEEESSDTQLWDEYGRLLQEIINERILFKDFRVDTDAGFVIEGQDGRIVPLERLSSGEQHMIILYYRLLFETEPDTLVMIDEPEISLNVVWQRNFLKDLQRIIELRKFDVLIASHSPQIVHDKWDWMVPLGEKVDD